MNRQVITFKVGETQALTRTSPLQTFAIETVNYIEAHFELPDSWKTFSDLYAVWYNGKAKEGSLINTDGVTVIPSVMLKTPGTLEVNLCGNEFKDGKLIGRWTSYVEKALMLKHTEV